MVIEHYGSSSKGLRAILMHGMWYARQLHPTSRKKEGGLGSE